MRKSLLTVIVFGAIAVALGFPGAPAYAQASRTWVSGVGDDANPCSRTAPCKTFAGAISKTAAAGEINCLDPGGFGALTITKSITISCETGTAGVLVSGTNGISVQIAATDSVTLRGLDFEGLNTGLRGISFSTGGTLHVEKCLIRGFTTGAIFFDPNASGTLDVKDTVVFDNSGGGIVVQPQTGGNAGVVLSNVYLAANGNGSGFLANVSTGVVNVAIVNSVSTGNGGEGFAVITSGGGSGKMTINRSLASSNGARGARVDGGGATALIGESVVSGNAFGVAQLNSASLQSYKNNQIDGNGTNIVGTLTVIQLN
jgi:hypothetical protein